MLLDLRSLEEASSGTVTYSYTGTGGIVFAGHAAEKFAWKYTVAGGIVFGGQEAEKFVFKYAPSGGIVFAGHATEKQTFAYDPAFAGIVFGGTIDESLTRKYLPTGGVVFGGQVVQKFTFKYPVSGGVVFSGAATTIFEPHGTNVYAYTGSGGIVFAGVAFTSGPAAVVSDDSRGWFQLRRHARARTEYVEAVVVASSRSREVRADAAVPVIGSIVPISFGAVSVYTDVSIAASPAVVGVNVRIAVGSVQVRSDSRIDVMSASVTVRTASVSALASTVIPIHGQRVRTNVGRVSVEIGPDLVQAEEDELIFLLEVA
jgi:hypothetical protein